jgi:murein L,D-transpeptidase YafK
VGASFHLLLLIGLQAAPARAVAPPPYDLEAGLSRSLLAVGSRRIDVALSELDDLLKAAPNFTLAQLVRGDLLMAQAGRLSGFGGAPNAPSEQVDALRDEARARLRRSQEAPSSALRPRYFWQLEARQRHAVVVDTSRSTLYLYENVGGQPRYLADYYVSVGKKGTDKVAEGDQRTPLGVYFISGYLGPERLSDQFGAGAYPLDYPNEWDRRQGRNGTDIWLHGTPSDTYSRPPRSSNGCVVLSNDDLARLGPNLEVGQTPVVITSQMDWTGEADQADRAELLEAVERWRRDWSSLDTEAFLEHYADDFTAGSVTRAAFAQQKRQANSGKSWIQVELSDLSALPYPGQPGPVVVTFTQDYRSNNLSDRMRKRQLWLKRAARWQIVHEGSAP